MDLAVADGRHLRGLVARGLLIVAVEVGHPLGLEVVEVEALENVLPKTLIMTDDEIEEQHVQVVVVHNDLIKSLELVC